jgi:hypothetical protein
MANLRKEGANKNVVELLLCEHGEKLNEWMEQPSSLKIMHVYVTFH